MKDSYEQLKQIYSHENAISEGSQNAIGTVYTPYEIAVQMVYLLISNQLELEKGDEYGIELDFDAIYLRAYRDQNSDISVSAHEAEALIQNLLRWRIIDFSCGSGALITAYLDFFNFLLIHNAHQTAPEHLKAYVHHFLTNCLYAIDIDDRATNALTDILMAYARSFGLTDIALNIATSNSLLAFPVTFPKEFDLIIGNPPYIGEKNNLTAFKPIKSTAFGRQFYEGKMDYFYFFIYLGHQLLKPNGSLCFISSNYFLTADGATKLRAFLNGHFHFSRYVDYGETPIFGNRKLHACSYVLTKSSQLTCKVYDSTLRMISELERSTLYHHDGCIRFVMSDLIMARLHQMKGVSIGTLGNFYTVNQGVVTGLDRCFVMDAPTAASLPPALQALSVPFYKNSDIQSYRVNPKHRRYLLYVDRAEVPDELIRRLTPFRERLSNRREVQRNVRAWYMLTWPRTRELFEHPKIVAPQRARTNRFAYVVEPFYASADVYYIQATSQSPYPLHLLVLILNASPVFQWLSHMGKRKGELLELYATPLKNIPLPPLDEGSIKILEGYAKAIDETVDETRLPSIYASLDDYVSSLYGLHDL